MRSILAVPVLAAMLAPHQASAFQIKAKSIYCETHPFEGDCLNMAPITLNGGIKMPVGSLVNPAVRPSPPNRPPAPPPLTRQSTLQGASQPALLTVGETDWRFADPLPALVGGVNVESLSHSQLVHKLLEQLAAQLGQSPEILNKLGDSSITRISFSVTQRRPEPSVLVLVQGSLDDATAAGLTQSKLEMRRVDLNSVLLGSGADLDAAMARIQSKRPFVRAGLLQEVQTLAASNDFWMAGSLPSLGAAKLPLPISALTLGLNLQKDVLLDLSMNTGSAKNAQMLLLQLQQSQKNDLAKIGASMNVGALGSTVRVRFAMNGESVSRALGEAMSEGLGTQFAGFMSMAGMPTAGLPAAASRAPSAAPTQPEAPTRKTAIIYGLEDGPREVQLGPKP